MASGDYYLCDLCGRKAFYDADLDYYTTPTSGQLVLEGVGDMSVLCDDCAKTHIVCIEPKSGRRHE